MSKNPHRKSKRARVRAKSKRDRKPRVRLLYRRGEVAQMLGVSTSTVARMEGDGRLPGRKLGPKGNCLTLYRAADVHRLAGVEIAQHDAI